MSDNLGFELPPLTGVASSLCVMLHGYGADGSDMISVATAMSPMLPDTHFVAPNGSEPCPTAPGFYQWYDPATGKSGADLAAQTLAPRINRYVDSQLEGLGLQSADLVMLGFSQGGGIMIEAALSRSQCCGALLCYTSALRNVATLDSLTQSRPDTLLVHGDSDPVIPLHHVDRAANALDAVGISVHTHICAGMGHTLNDEGAMVGALFAAEALDQR